jgi:hypothetical protein
MRIYEVLGHEHRRHQIVHICILPEEHKLYYATGSSCPCDVPLYWDCIVKSWGYEVCLFEVIGSYQGDMLILFHRKDVSTQDEWGYTSIAYGSCTGCDSLEWAKSTGAEEVRNTICEEHNKIQWKSAEEMNEWFQGRDWETQIESSIDSKGVQSFIKKAINIIHYGD